MASGSTRLARSLARPPTDRVTHRTASNYNRGYRDAREPIIRSGETEMLVPEYRAKRTRGYFELRIRLRIAGWTPAAEDGLK